MRIIDAEELEEMMWRTDVDTREKISNLIKAAPTEKRAIPFAWIEEYIWRTARKDTTLAAAAYMMFYTWMQEQGLFDKEGEEWEKLLTQ